MIIRAIEKNAGLIKPAAKMLGISRQALYQRIEKSDTLKEEVYQARESALDLAESKLFKNVQSGKEASIFFLLKTIGKKRGYIEKHEHEHSGTVNTVIVKPAQGCEPISEDE